MTCKINTSQMNNSAIPFSGAAPKLYTIKSEKAEKLLEKAGGLSTPENRFIMGITALSIQPWIDLNNKDVDEKTRKMSFARTCAKIITGTATGVAVRWACIRSIDHFTVTPKDVEDGKRITKWSRALIPDIEKNIKNGAKEVKPLTYEQFSKATRLVKKHRKALGSIIAIGVMLITNFALDVPITKFLTNFFSDKIQEADKKRSEMNGGN